jgi:hypothetical protein
MSACQGELSMKEFFVKATDQKGNVLVNKTMTTLRNGFFELWLPRERNVELIIQGMKRQVRGTIGTFDGSDTCVTSLQLR